mmetsp:Transcript_11141/g.11235  ORF Transcript_11141/g.11235 Transcript_11141/m.11235 type:complete len:240 (-) Transcript_11141:380-1099(-)
MKSESVCQNDETNSEINSNILHRAKKVFAQFPVLWYLFYETLSFQSLSSMLNVCFFTKLKFAFPDDVLRSAYIGKFYGAVSASAGILQFAVLPIFTKRFELKWIWRSMPLILCILTFLLVINQTIKDDTSLSSLLLVGLSFFSVKVMEYSARSYVSEMAYVPLDFESRFVGREVNGVIGNGFGRSGMSLVIAGLTSSYVNADQQILSVLSCVLSFTWLACSYQLSNAIVHQINRTKKES